jgi:hypothetical protein
MNLFFKGRIFKIATLLGGLFLVLLQIGCSKEVAVSDIDFQRHLIGGTGSFQNTFKIWKLDSISVDGKSLALTANQKKYTKKFYHSGAYIDSDGYIEKKQKISFANIKKTLTEIHALTTVAFTASVKG